MKLKRTRILPADANQIARAALRICGCVTVACLLPAFAQTALTWEQVKEKFAAANPTLQAGQINIQESKDQEITAYLRPNPNFSFTLDQLDFFSSNPYRPFAYTEPLASFDYLHERQHKRELRLESAQKGTAIAVSQQGDLERTLLFTLRTAFVQTLQAKQVLALAKDNLEYFDKELGISRERYKAGDIARVDLDRIELQLPQYQSDYETAMVNLRTAKITLLAMLSDRSPVDKFDVTGPFDFAEQLTPLEEFHTIALATRPDLKAAVAGGGQGGNRSQAGGGQWVDRSYIQRGLRPQPAHPGLHGRQHQHSAAHFRQEPGRESAHRDRHPARRAAARRRPEPGLQRCGFGLLHAGLGGESSASRTGERTAFSRAPPACATSFHFLTNTEARRWWTFWMHSTITGRCRSPTSI